MFLVLKLVVRSGVETEVVNLEKAVERVLKTTTSETIADLKAVHGILTRFAGALESLEDSMGRDAKSLATAVDEFLSSKQGKADLDALGKASAAVVPIVTAVVS